MKIESLKPGMIVYDVGRHKMGNTTLSTVAVWLVRIVSVDTDARQVIASWNGNSPRTFHESTWKKWRPKEPVLVKSGFGHRLATREELAELRNKEAKNAP